MPQASPAFVYLLRCSDGSYYAGWTTCLERRLAAHQAGKGSRYTRSRLPVALAWWEEHRSRSSAMRREAQVKKMARAAKLELVREGKPGKRRNEGVRG